MEMQIIFSKDKRKLVISLGRDYPFIRIMRFKALGRGAWYPVEIRRSRS